MGLINMFFIFKDDKIPDSTNALESLFGHLKGNLNIRRGLSLKNRKNFINGICIIKMKSINRFF